MLAAVEGPALVSGGRTAALIGDGRGCLEAADAGGRGASVCVEVTGRGWLWNSGSESLLMASMRVVMAVSVWSAALHTGGWCASWRLVSALSSAVTRIKVTLLLSRTKQWIVHGDMSAGKT